MSHQVGSSMPIHSKKACVVYDASSGQIRHLHTVVTFEGGQEPSPEQIAANALEVVAKLPKPHQGTLHVLHVDESSLVRGKKYRVDVKQKKLVAC